MGNRSRHHEFESLKHKDTLRLVAVLVSSIAIAIAGSLSQASEPGAFATKEIKEYELSREERAPKLASKHIQTHAKKQIAHFENLLESVAFRSSLELDAKTAARLKTSLELLESSLDDTRTALAELNSSLESSPESSQTRAQNVFDRESLRDSVLALQDAGYRAVGVMVDADLSAAARVGSQRKVTDL